MSADADRGRPGQDEMLDGYMAAVQTVLSYINEDRLQHDITPAVVDGLCLLVVEGLAQIEAAEAMLTPEQKAELHTGVMPASDRRGFPRAALESLLAGLMLAEAERD
jgi:hypothetical protein